MPAVSEKQVPRLLSIAAILIAVLATGWLYWRALADPPKYAMAMTFNHHAGGGDGYGSSMEVGCFDCHVPTGGKSLTTRMDCFTSGCHSDLKPGVDSAAARAHYSESRSTYTDLELRMDYHFGLHNAAADRSCAECHNEHGRAHAIYPDGWGSYDEWKQNRSMTSAPWRSVLASTNSLR